VPPSSSSVSFDVLVIGAGLVGASFALALRGGGLRVGVVEPSPPAPQSDTWDSRIYALNPASADFLQSLGAWSALDAARVQAVARMDIHGDALDSRLSFSAYETGVAALAHIVESGRLQHALWQALGAASNVEVISAARCVAVQFEPDQAVLNLDNGRTLRAALLVGADGANSWLRRASGLHTEVQPYEALGVVANFECERAHDGTAFQWFRADGILAYLPLPDARMSMVWSTPQIHGRELLDLPPERLAARVAEAGRHVLGKLQVITPPQAFPLQKLRVPNIVAPRVALIGDAAHVVHPLAGQGVNLGFGDAQALARHIAERESFRSCGDMVVLRRYQRSRAEPVAAMRVMTHTLQRLFAASSPALSAIRNRGLSRVDRAGPFKNLLVRQALG
jgi:ubiquinone biosynthesis UbiH/UbiF/VisC/COQ6 family hydroxylase